MAEASAAPSTEFEAIADELYSLKPDAFAAARDEQVKRLKAEGQKQLASEVGKLRRPTQSAWLVNLLWRDQGDVMEQLFELSGDLSRAQARASGDELRNLTSQRRAIESALMSRARQLAGQSGISLTQEHEREVQETLAAALANPEAADEVRGGRLVKPIEYAGFGTLSTAAPTREPTTPAREPTPLRRTTEEDRKEREARERAQEAQRAALEAGAALEGAKREAEERDHATEATRQQLAQVTADLERLRKQERDLEDALSGQERASREARRQLEDAQRDHAAAVREMEKAERELAELKKR